MARQVTPHGNTYYILGLYLNSSWKKPLGNHDLKSRLLVFEIDLNAP
jgi:hypothetical protein